MLDQLDRFDDPIPYTVSAATIEAAKLRGARLRRRRRLAVAGATVPFVLLLALIAGAAYVDHRSDEVHRVSVAAGDLTPVDGQPFNILLVGTDGPRGQAGVRADTIMVVHVDETAGRIGVLSIPRDLAFDENGPRIDSLLAAGGPQDLIETVQDRLGIDISHYVEIDEPGLADLIDAVGGIQVQASSELRDDSSGLHLQRGCNRLDGDQAVALVRSRHVAAATGDPTAPWAYDPTSDIGRERRQQELIDIIGRRLLTMPVDTSSFSTLLDVFADHTAVDAGFGRSEMLDLIRWGHGLDPSDVTTATLPVTPFVDPTGADVLHVDDAPAVVTPFLHGEAVPPTSVGTSTSESVAPCS